jgi:hypothetical protein
MPVKRRPGNAQGLTGRLFPHIMAQGMHRVHELFSSCSGSS